MRTRRSLLIAQVACTALFLYVAALSAFSYLNVLRHDYGFDADNAVIFAPLLSAPPGMTGQEFVGVYDAHGVRVRALAERLAQLPGVRVATPIQDSPLATWRPVAALGLPLAIVGLSSGLFFLVRTRTRELGIRVALGAVPEQARAFVLAYAGRIVLIGSTMGIVSGALVGRAMDGQLFGVGAVSLTTTVTVGALVAGLAWCAAYIPARRASQVDPAIVLRSE